MERVRLSLDELAEAGEPERCLAFDAPAAAEAVEVELSLGSPHLFAVDGERCFHVASTSETRPHRWARIEQVSMTTSTVRGRWIAMSTGDVFSRLDCGNLRSHPFFTF